MSRTLGNSIADSLQLSLGYAERLLAGIPADKFARFAANQNGPIESNHAAFVYGHLSLYPPRILKELGLTAPVLPPGFQEAFSKDAKCVDDPSGKVYPAMDVVTEFFFTGYRSGLTALREASDATLQQPNPLGGPWRRSFRPWDRCTTFMSAAT